MNKIRLIISVFSIMAAGSSFFANASESAKEESALTILFGRPVAQAFDVYQWKCEEAKKEELATLSVELKEGISIGHHKGGIVLKIHGQEDRFIQPKPADYSWMPQADEILTPHGLSAVEGLVKLMQAQMELMQKDPPDVVINRYDRDFNRKAEFRFFNAFEPSNGEVSITVFDISTDEKVSEFRGMLGSKESIDFAAPFESELNDLIKRFEKNEL